MVTDSLYAPYIDEKYREFSGKLSLTDTLPRAGIRIPVLRKLAKEVDWKELEILYHEDVILKGCAIGCSKISYREKVKAITELLPYLSSWDHTDTIQTTLKPTRKEEKEAFCFFASLLEDERVYPKRLGIVWLMSNRSRYDRETLLEMIVRADDEKEYYIQMAVAWAMSYFFFDDESARDWFDRLSPVTRRMTEQKIRDSIRRNKPKL